jgi:hypothetical protein
LFKYGPTSADMRRVEQHQKTSARWAGRLFFVSGFLTVVNNYLPDSGYLNRGPLNALGTLAMLLSLLVHALPWDRWSSKTQLFLVPLALGMVSAGDLFGGVSGYSYAVYYVVIFVWVGIAQPPRTSFFLVPLAVCAYVVPGILNPEPGVAAISSVTVAVPVCVLVAETIARVMRKAAVRGELLHVLATASGMVVAKHRDDSAAETVWVLSARLAGYVRRSLPRLLESVDCTFRGPLDRLALFLRASSLERSV